MKTPLGLISFFTALSLAALMAVSCGKDKIIVEKPVIYDTNGLPVMTIKTDSKGIAQTAADALRIM